MVDIHYHLIFGVDDGPKTIEDSLALAEASLAEGVTHIVATPHANGRYNFRPDVNREKLEILKERLGDRLTLALGCDFHLSYDNIVDLEKVPERYTVNGKQYLLVEFDDSVIPRSLSDVLYQMRSNGVVPILTHPERNLVLTEDPQRVEEWAASGCLVQITAGSLSGRFGPKAKSMAFQLIRKKLVHLIASDAHSVKWRPPSMQAAYEVVRDKFGSATADRLCVQNPRAVFYGEPLPPEPQGSHIGEQPKTGLFARIFRR